jgi:hypothetical protein
MVGLAGMVALAAAPAPESSWTLPKADADKWVGRVRALIRDGWTVSARGNDIVIRRDKPVQFAQVEINAPPLPPGKERRPNLEEGVFQLTLRFAPRMTTDEYERLAAMNAASERERDRLRRAVGVSHKFDQFLPSTPEEKERVRAYHEAVAKLPWHTLPDLYTPEYSICLLRSGSGLSYVFDKPAAAECQDVEETLLRYFGMYNPLAARKGQGVGQYDGRDRR